MNRRFLRGRATRRIAAMGRGALWVGLIWSIVGSGCVVQAARMVGGQQSSLSIQAGQGRLINFAQPVTSVFVGDPQIADVKVVSPTWVYVFGTQPGSTNLIALDGDQHVRASMQLQVSIDRQTARNTLAAAGAGQAVRVRAVGNQLIVDGRVDNVGQAMLGQSVIEQNTPKGGSAIDRRTYQGATQINIRVRFAEVSRNKLRRYGVNWNALVDSGSFAFGLLTGGALSGGASNVASVGYTNGGDSVQTLINALQSDGLVKILAEPNITTVTGQTASFLAGGEIPIPVPVNQDLVGIQYKRYGVSLLCTPTLLPDGRISMQVKPEVSSLVAGSNVEIAGYSIPAIQVRSANTVVQVASGQTFAIAGLFQRSDSNALHELPVIGDIPIIGQLFRSRSFQHRETELVLLITPYLVKPSSAREPATPLDEKQKTTPETQPLARRVAADSDFGFYLH